MADFVKELEIGAPTIKMDRKIVQTASSVD